MTIGTWLHTVLRGAPVGRDAQGNRYYQERRTPRGRRRTRWVRYNGKAEASRIPPEWNAWLHYTVDYVPSETPRPAKAWQKEHVPNRTGTTSAYRPPGHDYEGGNRAPATGDYQPWRPPS